MNSSTCASSRFSAYSEAAAPKVTAPLDRSFAAFRTIATLYWCAALCAFAAGSVIGLLLGGPISGDRGAGFVTFIVPTLYGALVGLALLALPKVTKLFLLIAENVRNAHRERSN